MPRTYVQRARADAAQRTRAQILEAARAVLLEAPTLDVPVGAVADKAGVARSTVYAAFGSRAGLLAALADETLHGAGLGEVIGAFQQPDTVAALEDSLRASCRMYAAAHRVFVRLLALGQVDPEAAAPIARSQADRGAGLADLAGRLAAQGRLRPGVTPEHATAVLWLLSGFGTFDELHSGRGLGAGDAADLLVGLARSALLVDAPPGRSG